MHRALIECCKYNYVLELSSLAPRRTRAISPVMARKHVNLGRAPAKADLPSKLCEACKRPFTWRRKWARDWEQVRYCSDRCRGAGR